VIHGHAGGALHQRFDDHRGGAIRMFGEKRLHLAMARQA
jgi:hypothetical protein